jgi:hypothetical protein
MTNNKENAAMSDYIDRHAAMLRNADHMITLEQRFELAEALENMHDQLATHREAMCRIGSLLRSAAGTPLVRVLPEHIANLIAQVQA